MVGTVSACVAPVGVIYFRGVLRDDLAGLLAANEELEKLTMMARRLGWTRLEVPGLAIELGSVALEAPVDPAEERRAAREAARATFAEQWNAEWGHTGAPMPTNDEIDKMLGFAS